MLPSSWKRDIASGLIVLVPVMITLYVLFIIYSSIANLPFLDNLGRVAIEVSGRSVDVTPYVRVGILIAVLASLVVSTGYMMRTTAGDLFERALDGMMNRVPGLRVVYNASKMAMETAMSGGTDLQAPVKVETWPGMRMTAFKTGKTTADGKDIVFLPTAPNITTGFVVELDPDDYEETDESVEDALTRILSAGFGEDDSGELVGLEELTGDDDGAESPSVPDEEPPSVPDDDGVEAAGDATD